MEVGERGLGGRGVLNRGKGTGTSREGTQQEKGTGWEGTQQGKGDWVGGDSTGERDRVGGGTQQRRGPGGRGLGGRGLNRAYVGEGGDWVGGGTQQGICRGKAWEGTQQGTCQTSLCLSSYRVQTTSMRAMSVDTTDQMRSSSHKVCRVQSSRANYHPPSFLCRAIHPKTHRYVCTCSDVHT